MKKIEKATVINLFKILSLNFFVFVVSCSKKNQTIKKKLEYYNNKSLKEITYFENGYINGVNIKLYPNNMIKSFTLYKNDTVEIINSFHKNGQLMVKGQYKKGKEHGEWLFYYYGGQLLRKGSFNGGKEIGKWAQYYEDGTIEIESEFDTMGNEIILKDNRIEEIQEVPDL
jgi:antitoxin component YwqK of YwqJK toxin-antitoxin module